MSSRMIGGNFVHYNHPLQLNHCILVVRKCKVKHFRCQPQGFWLPFIQTLQPKNLLLTTTFICLCIFSLWVAITLLQHVVVWTSFLLVNVWTPFIPCKLKSTNDVHKMNIQIQHWIQTQHYVPNNVPMYQCHIYKDFEYTKVVHTIAFRLCVGSRVASLTMDFKLPFVIGALSFSGRMERVGRRTNLLARSLYTLWGMESKGWMNGSMDRWMMLVSIPYPCLSPFSIHLIFVGSIP